jgi:hypothetical protein
MFACKTYLTNAVNQQILPIFILIRFKKKLIVNKYYHCCDC